MNLTIILIFFLALSFFLAVSQADAIFVNEFMPDPSDTCRDCSEWIEITSNVDATLENIKLGTGNGWMWLNGSITADEFIIITRNKSIFSGIWNLENITIFESSKIELTNSGGNITLYNNSDEIQHLSYSHAKNNTSYGLCGGFLIQQNISSPGLHNVCEPPIINETNETYQNCSISLSIDSGILFDSGEKMNYFILIYDESCQEKEVTIEYWIDDLFNRTVKPRYNTTQNVTCFKNITREWTADRLEGIEAYNIKAAIRKTGCNDSDFSDNYNEKIIVMRGDPPSYNSSISIIDIDIGSDGKATFGDALDIKMNIYKGDTNKNAIAIWFENSAGQKTGKTGINLYSKFSNYTIYLPIQISPNCDGALENGNYFLKAEGLDSYAEKGTLIDGVSTSLCKTKTVEVVKPCSCSPCSSCSTQSKNESQHKRFEVVSCPEEIARNMELPIEVLINTTQKGNYTLYSYIYDGQKPLSLGFDGEKWLNTWSANKQEVYISVPTIITLKNRIANDTEPGKYKLRVKTVYNGKEEEITRNITIKEAVMPASQKTETEIIAENNETYDNDGQKRENLTKKEIKTPTGGFVSKKEGNWFSDAIDNLINFFKNLFKL